MKVLAKYIVIKPIEEERLTDSGLLLSSDEADFNLRYRKGFVHQCGTGVEDVSDGDEIYYDKNAGFKLMLGQDSFLVILERDVVLVL